MKHCKRLICMLVATTLLLAACSDKGVRMPRHRKKVHCDCPTFSENVQPEKASDDMMFWRVM